ncbi:MAG: DNA replication and repair protein RecF [Opitutaceae bacterium]|nr:DNA replication and repair protein RecF [Opitutaceae bacterium]
MRLRRILLQHVRNIPQADLELAGTRQFFIGPNGQGKTNLLEAVGFLTALRSFRTHDARMLIAHGQTEAALAFELDHERAGATRVTVRVRSGSKEVTVDQERVVKLGDILGRFPTVVFSSQDQQLIRGAPGGRRRWLDLTLAATDPAYLQTLQTYHRSLAGRNALLKRAASTAELAAFERPLAQAGCRLMQDRVSGLERLTAHVVRAYGRIATPGSPETVGFAYAPNLATSDERTWLQALAAGRARDVQFRSTLTGPHRDDLEFALDGRPARDVASEGQQRSLVLALKVAQAHWFQACTGVAPVLLADDVLGELDPGRRARFWEAIEPEWQILATGTTLPESDPLPWNVITVAKGTFARTESP